MIPLKHPVDFLFGVFLLTAPVRVRRAALAGLVVFASVVIVPGTAHANGSDSNSSSKSSSDKSYNKSNNPPKKTTTTTAKQNSAIGAVPFIQLTANNAAVTTTTTAANNSIGAVTEIPLNNRNDATTTTVAAVTTTTVVAAADTNDDSLASTGFNATQLAGFGMILTAFGLAFLAFTGALGRTQQFVTSLVPHRSPRK